ncbi:hypothetical protein [Mycolicibacterium wolinskyi]|uniref:hypothetical protein n=1 Tax=Mycolicibacterium wolinskyi TaxID=59750 RepID=UPI0039176F59
MIASAGLVALLVGSLAVGWLIGARDTNAHNKLHAQIDADTRTAFIDDAAELAADSDDL